MDLIICFNWKQVCQRDALIKNRQRVNSKNKSRENLVIYGAGTAGAKLASMIKTEGKANVVFVDDSPLLVGRTLDSIPIKSPKNLKNSKYKINKKFSNIINFQF